MDNTLCIVMRTADWRDSDKMLTLFSREGGLLSALARGAKNLKNPIAAASQPFCCGVYSLVSRSGRLYVSQCEIKKGFYNLGADFERYAAACTMMELTEKILQNTEDYEHLFVLLVTCLTHLEKGQDPRQMLAYFLSQLANLLGIRPSVRTCAICGADIDAPHLFCASEGGAVCAGCASGLHTATLRPDDFIRLEKMMDTIPKEFSQSPGFAPELLDVLREYLDVLGDLKCRSIQFL